MLAPARLHPVVWESVKMIGSQSRIESVDFYTPTGATQPLLGLGWDQDAGRRNQWNIVFGLGLYISNYRDGNHSAEGIDLNGPVSDSEQTDLFEKIKNALQVVGFRIRYAF